MDGVNSTPGTGDAGAEAVEALLRSRTWEERLAEARARRDRLLAERGRPKDSFFEERGPRPWERRGAEADPSPDPKADEAIRNASLASLPEERRKSIEARMAAAEASAKDKDAAPAHPQGARVVPLASARAARPAPQVADDALSRETTPPGALRALAGGGQAKPAEARLPVSDDEASAMAPVRGLPVALDTTVADAIRSGHAGTLLPVPYTKPKRGTPKSLVLGFSIGLGIGVGLAAAGALIEPLLTRQSGTEVALAPALVEPSAPQESAPDTAVVATPSPAPVVEAAPSQEVVAVAPADPVDGARPVERPSQAEAPIVAAIPVVSAELPASLALPVAEGAAASPPAAEGAFAQAPLARLPEMTADAPAFEIPAAPVTRPVAASAPESLTVPGSDIAETGIAGEVSVALPPSASLAPASGAPDEPDLTAARAPAPLPEAEPQPVIASAFAGVSLRLMTSPRVTDDAVAGAEDRLRAAGFGDPELRSIDYVIRSDHVRFYHAEDREAAEAAAKAIEGEARDFSGSAIVKPPGQIEVWLRNAEPKSAASAPAPAKPKRTKAAPARSAPSEAELERALRDRILQKLRARN